MIRRPPTQLPPTLPIYPLVKYRPELSSCSQLALTAGAGAMSWPWATSRVVLCSRGSCSPAEPPLSTAALPWHITWLHLSHGPTTGPCAHTKKLEKFQKLPSAPTRALDHHIPSPAAERRWWWWDLSRFACKTALQKASKRQAVKSKLRLFVLISSDRSKGSCFPLFWRFLSFRWQCAFTAPRSTACAPSLAAEHPLPVLNHRWVNFPENPAQAIKMLMLWGKCLRWSELIRESVVLGGRGTVYWFWTRSYLIRLATWIIFVCADQLPSPWFHSKFEITLMKQKFEGGWFPSQDFSLLQKCAPSPVYLWPPAHLGAC